MTTTALVVAIVSLALSVAALTWQLVQFRLTGSVVKVKSSYSYSLGTASGTDKFLTVQISNVGRAAVTVYGYGYELPAPVGGTIIDFGANAYSPSMPYRLEAGSEASFHMPQWQVERDAAGQGVTIKQLRPFARVAGDKTIYGKAPL